MSMPVRRALSASAIALSIVACAGTPASTPTRLPTTPAASTTPTASTSTATSPTVAASLSIRRLAGFEQRLAAGTYEYRETAPSTSFTVADGWNVTWTMPRHFGLRPLAAASSDDTISVWYDMRLSATGPECAEEPLAGVGHTAADMVDGLTTRAGLVTTTPEPITVGGLDGQWFDVRLAHDWTIPCPFTDGVPSVTMFLDDEVPDEPAFWGVSGPDERLRFIVLDDGGGSNILLVVDATTPASFDALIDEAMPLFETFRFEP